MDIDLIPQVETIHPRLTEAIVLRFPLKEVSLAEMQSIFNCVKSAFPDNAVVAIPDNVSLRSYSKDTLENVICEMQEIIDAL